MKENSMFLYGKNSVFERLKNNPQSIKIIYLQDNFDAPHIEQMIKQKSIRCERVSQKKLNSIKLHSHLQGIIAQAESFKYADFNELLDISKAQSLTFIFLDRLLDPQNLGSIMRTAACFGKFAIVIPKHKACEVTESVIHVASGGENFIQVAMVSNLTNAILEAKKNGIWIAGAVIEGGEDIDKVDLPFPLGLVLGSEGVGIRYGVGKHLDLKVKIPMQGAPLSLNINVACSIFCHQIAIARKK